MFITVGENEYELSTKLGTTAAIELKFSITLPQIQQKLEDALAGELIDILAIAAGKQNKAEERQAFRKEILENWDYSDLQMAASELLTRLMFSGTPEQIEAKLAKYPAPEEQKNAIRELLGLPTVPVEIETGSTGEN